MNAVEFASLAFMIDIVSIQPPPNAVGGERSCEALIACSTNLRVSTHDPRVATA